MPQWNNRFDAGVIYRYRNSGRSRVADEDASSTTTRQGRAQLT